MRSLPLVSLLLTIALLALPGCGTTKNPHFFPRLHPLFAGLDEGTVRPGARLAQAKADFQLARHGKEPQYAKYVSIIPYTRSRVYEGKGYRLTIVHKEIGAVHSDGPKIVLDASITGGKPFCYCEVDELSD